MPRTEALTGDLLAKPKININGSSAQTLIDDMVAVTTQLIEAERMLQQIRPHPRDFQTTSADVYDMAREQHEARIKMVHRCYVELEEIALHVQRQQHAREEIMNGLKRTPPQEHIGEPKKRKG